VVENLCVLPKSFDYLLTDSHHRRSQPKPVVNATATRKLLSVSDAPNTSKNLKRRSRYTEINCAIWRQRVLEL
jgi:hypothetical protein